MPSWSAISPANPLFVRISTRSGPIKRCCRCYRDIGVGEPTLDTLPLATIAFREYQVHRPTHPRSYRLRHRIVQLREIHVVPPSLEKRARAIQHRVNDVVEPLLAPGVHGYRKGHSVSTAISHIHRLAGSRVAFDIENYFASIDKTRLKRMVDKVDASLWWEIDPFLGAKGLRTGPSFSPMLSNLYLNELDHRFGWVRYCDNIMIVAPDADLIFRRARRHLADIGLVCHEIEVDPTVFLRQPLEEVIPTQ